MQAEIDGEGTSVPISIIGINEVGQEGGNDQMVDGRLLPWLQDTEEGDVWGAWKASWRDVVVVDEQLHPVAVINLTDHDLGESRWYDGLRDFLLDNATRE